jgi:excisionase family DNA binding protein
VASFLLQALRPCRGEPMLAITAQPKRPSYSMVHSATRSLRFAELPEILTPKHLIDYLPLGRDAIYEALKSQTIRNVRVGQKFIITKDALREFLGGGVE